MIIQSQAYRQSQRGIRIYLPRTPRENVVQTQCRWNEWLWCCSFAYTLSMCNRFDFRTGSHASRIRTQGRLLLWRTCPLRAVANTASWVCRDERAKPTPEDAMHCLVLHYCNHIPSLPGGLHFIFYVHCPVHWGITIHCSSDSVSCKTRIPP